MTGPFGSNCCTWSGHKHQSTLYIIASVIAKWMEFCCLRISTHNGYWKVHRLPIRTLSTRTLFFLNCWWHRCVFFSCVLMLLFQQRYCILYRIIWGAGCVWMWNPKGVMFDYWFDGESILAIFSIFIELTFSSDVTVVINCHSLFFCWGNESETCAAVIDALRTNVSSIQNLLWNEKRMVLVGVCVLWRAINSF